MVRIYQHAIFEAIPTFCSQENARKSQIWPVSLSQNGAKIRNINRPWPKNLFYSETGQNIPTCHIWGHSYLLFIRKCPEIANLACFTKSKCHPNEENQFSRWSGYISNFRPFKLSAIKLMWRISVFFDATTNTKWKGTIEQNAKKNK